MQFETLKKDNRKKWIVGVIAVLAIASVVFFVSTRANYKTTERLNLINTTINYSLTDLEIVSIRLKDGDNYTDTNTVPTSGYILNTTETVCNDKSGNKLNTTFEYKDGKVYIDITQKGTKCTLVFDKEKCGALCKQLIAKNEMVHETFTNENGELVDTGYRYEGKTPKNYVTFNGEKWRIIGVFDIETEAGETESLVKLIRNESIGNIKWDSDSSNDWTESDLKTILNGQYYNGEDINYTYRNSGSGTLSIVGKSIGDTARSMIESVKWNTGKSTIALTSSAMYINERGTTGGGTNPTASIWPGHIGLMYPSDYGYAVDSTSCPRTTILKNYYSAGSCYSNDWLYKGVSEWSLTSHASATNFGLYVIYDGYVGQADVTRDFSVRPSIYLKSNVSIVDNGKDGSYDYPYDLVLS